MRVLPTPRQIARCLGGTLAAALLATGANALSIYEIVTLGFTDEKHTSEYGDQESYTELLSDSGYVAGRSYTYSGSIVMGSSAWFHDANASTTTQIGLLDGIHTSGAGNQSSAVIRLGRAGFEAGFVAGYSRRYSSPAGFSAWVFDASDDSTMRVGLFDAPHVSSTGTQDSSVMFLSGSGYAAGKSTRYDVTSGPNGLSSWVYDPGDDSSTITGYYDADHTSTTGRRESTALGLNESGYAIGSSLRFSGASSNGSTAWLYHAGSDTLTRIGFFGAGYVNTSTGAQSSTPVTISDSGRVIGFSSRYNGSLSAGTDAWLHDLVAPSTSRIGFYDAEHTRSDGFQASSVDVSAKLLTDSGYAAGTSDRFAGAAARGKSAWVYAASSATTTRVGLVDAAHTRNDDFKQSSVTKLSESGYAAGTSFRYLGGATQLGNSAWIRDPNTGTTTRTGLYNAFHTRSDGLQQSTPAALTDSGYAVGTAVSYPSGGVAPLGTSVWLYAPGTGTTTRLGLFDATHTQSGGLQDSAWDAITESGLVAGSSARFNGSTTLGRTAWVYDANDGSLDAIVLATQPDDFAYAEITHLGEDGLALGLYIVGFDEQLDDYAWRAFAWTAESGAVDLGSFVAGGLAANGWDHLGEDSFYGEVLGNESGMAIGAGRRESGGCCTPIRILPFLLKPIPEPEAALQWTAGILTLVWLGRRRSRESGLA